MPTPLPDPRLIFLASSDFLMGFELLYAHAPSASEGPAPWPVRAAAVCSSMALELGHKCHAVLDGKPPLSRRDGHDYVALFSALLKKTQEQIASAYSEIPGEHPITPDGVAMVLGGLNGTFEQWRYLYEKDVRYILNKYPEVRGKLAMSSGSPEGMRRLHEEHPEIWLKAFNVPNMLSAVKATHSAALRRKPEWSAGS